MNLTPRDQQRLAGVHPDLIAIVQRAASITAVDFMVIEGVRTLAKQKEYFAAGKSKTMKSRHLTGHAVDLAPLLDLDGDGDIELSWASKDFLPISYAMRDAAVALKMSVEWGGLWKTFHDAPHFELPWAIYP